MYLFLQFDGPINGVKQTMSSAVLYSPVVKRSINIEAHSKKHGNTTKRKEKEKAGSLLRLTVS